jgi:hypothetical protein
MTFYSDIQLLDRLAKSGDKSINIMSMFTASKFNPLDEVNEQYGDQTIFDLATSSPSDVTKHLFGNIDWQEKTKQGILSQSEVSFNI